MLPIIIPTVSVVDLHLEGNSDIHLLTEDPSAPAKETAVAWLVHETRQSDDGEA